MSFYIHFYVKSHFSIQIFDLNGGPKLDYYCSESDVY